MPQPIQVPQPTPNPVQFQVPTDLVNAYLSRQQQGNQDTMNRIQELGSTLNSYKQQKIQNQLNALAAYASIAKAVGPDSANQVAGQIPNMPNWNQPQPTGSPTPPPMQTQGQPTPPTQGTPATGISAGATSAPQDTSLSPAIQASVALGHPDITGHVQKFQSGQIPPGGTVPLTNLSDQIASLNAEMPKYQNKGDWGMQQQKQISDQIAGLKAQQEAANSPEQFTAGKNIETSQFQTTKQQELNAKKAAIEKDFQTKNEAINSAIDAIQSSLLLKNKAIDEAGPFKGRVQSELQNIKASGPTYELNKNNEFQRSKLQHVQEVNRFNPEEVQYIGGGSLAQPIEPMDTSLSKGQNAVDAFNRQLTRNQAEKNAQLKALNLPEDNTPIQKLNLSDWLKSQSASKATPVSNIPTISSDAAFNALPKGSQFKDPSGQIHTKK